MVAEVYVHYVCEIKFAIVREPQSTFRVTN